MMRSTIERVTFRHAFTLRGVDERQPPGTYEVETDEEPIVGLSFLAYRRVATAIRIPMAGQRCRLQPDLPDRPARPGGGTSPRFPGGEPEHEDRPGRAAVRGRPAAPLRRHRADRRPSHRRPGRARPRRDAVRQRRGARPGRSWCRCATRPSGSIRRRSSPISRRTCRCCTRCAAGGTSSTSSISTST